MEAPYIVWRARFLGEKSAGMLATDVGMAVATFLPKLRGPGTSPGSADPPLPPLPTVFCRVAVRWVLFSDMSVPGFVWSVCSDMWASFGCVTQDAIFCDFICVFIVFSSYSGFMLLKI